MHVNPKGILVDLIENFIRIKLSLMVYEYIDDRNKREYVDFEMEMDACNYPIRPCTIHVSKSIINNCFSTKNYYLIEGDETPIGTSEITTEIVSTPLPINKMIFLYLFTMVENFGNSLVEIYNKPYYEKVIIAKDKTWHSCVNQFVTCGFQEKFSEVIGKESVIVDEMFFKILLKMKKYRNAIAHGDEYDEMNFSDDVLSLIIISSYLYFLFSEEDDDILVFPWEDYLSSVEKKYHVKNRKEMR